MRISFRRRPIYQAPVAVLHHLYYYTKQYGLSVRQFTGEHWRYWEELPARLRGVEGNPAALDAVITELEELAAGSEKRLRRRRAQIEGKWDEKEVVINAQLLSVLGALPDGMLASGFGRAMGIEDLPRNLAIVDLVVEAGAGEDADFVEPDLLLLGDRHLLMVEVKTRGGAASSRKYPPGQLLNYLQLAARCLDQRDDVSPDRFSHLILVPSVDPQWIESHGQWVADTCDERGRVRLDPSACVSLTRPKQSYDYGQLMKLVDDIPIYYRSWEQLAGAFAWAAEHAGDEQNRRHWSTVVGEIEELAQRAGKYA